MRRAIRSLRKGMGSKLAEGFFAGASKLGKLHPRAKPERHGVQVLRDVRYGPPGASEEHHLDVYRPLDLDGPAPIVLYIHGGGFRILSKDTHWIMGLAFASRGYVVFNIGYRLAPRHPFPAAVEDVSLAYQWLVEHAAEYGGDLDRLVIAGESAGANLTTSLTLATVYERPEPYARAVFETGVVPKAAIPACGVFQVSDMERYRRRKPRFPTFLMDRLREVQDGYLGERPEQYGPSLDLADVLTWLERGDAPARPLPPFFLPVGTKDPLLDDTRRLDKALKALGGTSEAVYYPGDIHAFHAFVFLESAQRCWRDQFDFLERHV
ncbi:MAG: alpha/beta hydrolase [Myxococcales bacterium]|nr:alpha/beta hydrolase [Myxococcales bacterium]